MQMHADARTTVYKPAVCVGFLDKDERGGGWICLLRPGWGLASWLGRGPHLLFLLGSET